MKIITGLQAMSKFSFEQKRKGNKIGFVPTMGALHGGHLSLIRSARKDNDLVVVSVFVNPTQFGPKEDLKTYPRVFLKDATLCREEEVDVLFSPSAQDMYPKGFKTYLNVEDLSEKLCGSFRPGHFKGVATVVVKLFNIVKPDNAYFGMKDAQQFLIIKRLAFDLNFPVKIHVCPTIREKDGLAMSSRNRYLSPALRRQALVLPKSLQLAKRLIHLGERSPKKIIGRMRRIICTAKDSRLDYISVTDLDNLEPLKKIKDEALVALAVWIGRTRLIDNCILRLKD